VVLGYLNRNPDKRDLAAAALVVAAMDEAWCPQAPAAPTVQYKPHWSRGPPCPPAASRRLGLPRNWTPALSSKTAAVESWRVYYEEESGRYLIRPFAQRAQANFGWGAGACGKFFKGRRKRNTERIPSIDVLFKHLRRLKRVLEYLLRFIAGGAVVSAFAVLGDILRPKSFAGLFGAAPSIALATILITLSQKGAPFVAAEARSMIVGAFALAAYSWTVCIVIKKSRSRPWPPLRPNLVAVAELKKRAKEPRE
jgi:hypothetical protein